mgnify:CR=1 FL=1
MRGVPRRRGDQPLDATLHPGRGGRSPQARGSTACRLEALHRTAAFPAGAGINRWRVQAQERIGGVPRRRGDQPLLPEARAEWYTRSPQARGSTGIALQIGDGAGAFPAGAGINRCSASANQRTSGVPRRRGDQPHQRGVSVPQEGRSPQARGSTAHRTRYKPAHAAFPAGAGINRACWHLPARAAGVPRRRGDQPSTEQQLSTVEERSPQARGSTGCESARVPLACAFPAGAGINRADRKAQATGCGVPRRRGDQPVALQGATIAAGRSPQARGSTGVLQLRRQGVDAFPAGAGINRSRLIWRWISTCVPRRRGDQPRLATSHRLVLARSPQARGSTVGLRHAGLVNGAFPAGAGINPPVPFRAATVSWRSPQARGSTATTMPVLAELAAFPAGAGINRYRTRAGPWPCGVPRRRGDQPPAVAGLCGLIARSPQARGSTGRSLQLLG